MWYFAVELYIFFHSLVVVVIFICLGYLYIETFDTKEIWKFAWIFSRDGYVSFARWNEKGFTDTDSFEILFRGEIRENFVNTLLKIVSAGKYSGTKVKKICFEEIKNIEIQWKARENERKINGVGESGHAWKISQLRRFNGWQIFFFS